MADKGNAAPQPPKQQNAYGFPEDKILDRTDNLKSADVEELDCNESAIELTEVTGVFRHVGQVIPYFRNPRHVLLFKLDVMLLAWMFLAGIMKEMDQSATTQAYVSGMRESLNLRGNELVNFNTFFSIGYAIFLIPGQLIQTKVRPSYFLPTCEIIWGLLVLFTYKAPDAKTIYALRFFLGALAAAFWPTVVSLIFNWYTPKELAFRLACFNVSDVAGAMFLGALQAALYRNMNGVHNLAGWQWLFIIAGSVTVGQGLLGFITIPDSPAITRALWLTKEERRLANWRMNSFGANTSELISASLLRKKLRKIVVHPITYFFLFGFALAAWAHRANSYFVLYLESIKNPAGERVYSTYQVNILPLGGYALQIVTSVGLNALSDWKNWRWQVSVGSLTAHAIFLAVLCAWPARDHVVMAFYFLTYTTNANGPSLMAWMAELMRKEPEARSIIVAMTVTIVYVGHATIPLGAWRVADAPKYPIGFPLAVAMTVASIFVQLGLRVWEKKHPEITERGLE
ncbi:major facilitator superfamily transporter [Aaosphaeria arxii CBS 175.79]|uniref:Major facilitator superfamily transporter n=1 Tax=Aaosphaeria arxii CBS 175.79 TaxID=1450172 RepID=A0A6A5XCQ4_9PLEO|nr:major facilitator superfamily transporter [Aaosphaeria arxii CBS 175.79]KAF2010758.1 major facilitator superfamily transporter [Aaosphaeria arxii CBS 175.79]